MFDYCDSYEDAILAWQEAIETAEFNGETPYEDLIREEVHYNPDIMRMLYDARKRAS